MSGSPFISSYAGLFSFQKRVVACKVIHQNTARLMQFYFASVGAQEVTIVVHVLSFLGSIFALSAMSFQLNTPLAFSTSTVEGFFISVILDLKSLFNGTSSFMYSCLVQDGTQPGRQCLMCSALPRPPSWRSAGPTLARSAPGPAWAQAP